ncbi:hypothetical protein PT974_03822 [Cladobotryum mycophilum]|uniref:Uncharacterized protein n=1 Tax=Cladobotryum mycophilum TaxID=491253 RepID=A0ABR0SU02_9HYPO
MATIQDMRDDFNSSDSELLEPQSHSESVKDRILNGSTVKTHALTASNRAQAHRSLVWSNIFQSFRQRFLKCDLESTPTSQQVIQFLDALPGKLDGRGDGGIPSRASVRTALYHINQWATSRFRDFSLCERDLSRIDRLIWLMVNQGRIHNDPIREPLWIGSDYIFLMVKALYKDALQNGTLNWDITIMKALCILLTSALGTRPGDILVDEESENDRHLRWEHVHIILDPLNEDRMICTVTVKYTKEAIFDSKAVKCVVFGELTDPKFHSVCVIRTLIAFALRTGAVAETSLAQLKANMKAQPSKHLIWSTPKRPIFCTLIDTTAKMPALRYDHPAKTRLLRKALEKAALLIGLIKEPNPYDLRRAAAYEHATLSLPGLSGVDSWNHRLENPASKRAKHVLQIAIEGPPPKKKKLKRQEVDAACQILGLDNENIKARAAVVILIQKQLLANWRENQERLMDDMAQPSEDLNNEGEPTCFDHNQDSEDKDDDHSMRIVDYDSDFDESEGEDDGGDDDRLVKSRLAELYELMSGESSRTLAEERQSLERALKDNSLLNHYNTPRNSGISSQGPDNTLQDSMTEFRLFVKSIEDHVSTPQNPLNRTRDTSVIDNPQGEDFITFLCSINEFKSNNQTLKPHEVPTYASGEGSRNEPTCFTYE